MPDDVKLEAMAETDSAGARLDRSSAERLVALSEALRRFVEFFGKWGSLLILPLILLTMWDVAQRKIRKMIGDVLLSLSNGEDSIYLDLRNFLEDVVFQVVPFRSTLLQELEWHFHTGLFVLVLGYGYVYNTHVRVDLVRERLSFRKKAWLEFLGSSLFMIPYCLIVIYFAASFAYESYEISEISASTVGLTHRWIIKSVLVFGLCVATVAGFAVWLQSALVLFGPRELRFRLMALEWPEEEGSTIEGKQRVELDEEAKKVLVEELEPEEPPPEGAEKEKVASA